MCIFKVAFEHNLCKILGCEQEILDRLNREICSGLHNVELRSAGLGKNALKFVNLIIEKLKISSTTFKNIYTN